MQRPVPILFALLVAAVLAGASPTHPPLTAVGRTGLGHTERASSPVPAATAERELVLDPLPANAFSDRSGELPSQHPVLVQQLAGEDAPVLPGYAFDVTARRTQRDFQRLSAEVTEAAWEVRLHNAGPHPATVTVREAFGGDWLVIDETRPHTKESATVARWSVPLPAKGDAVLRYRVRVRG
jgi:hypothetical protein